MNFIFLCTGICFPHVLVWFFSCFMLICCVYDVRSVKDLARLSLKDPMYVSVHENAQHSTPTQLEQVHGVFISRRRRRPGDGRYCNAPHPSVRLSVRLSVRHVNFRTVTKKMHCCIFSKLCRYVHQVMGVCCIVFDIDGMLFEFFMIF